MTQDSESEPPAFTDQNVPANPWSSSCPSRAIIDLIASKWVLLVIPLLRDGPMRNNDLLRAVEGMSQKMLTQTLRGLRDHSLVERRDFNEMPPRGGIFAVASRTVARKVASSFG